ncbi:TIR domain-containing protein [Frankia sp. AgB1.9]|uniref:TIR domain-containing protein n=1 Tax=unclassified Frankia TaxID=2632575 RepID=UPI00193359F4|nr:MULTISPECIES: TIR domain-containing protein [unclassified Frankia]MBL7487591.1 TIR domain-containing protein [Frankia sp. AgW1.1]MBL7548943.1 TIR domain-containing protein [Frankia sp. AgB1.9]MBL7623479.1 TIR domain-containing protein [Frankia sp. AgB1.8]
MVLGKARNGRTVSRRLLIDKSNRPRLGPLRDYKYNVFISYTHQEPDKTWAVGIQRALHRLGHRWPKTRALSVFLDKSNITPSGNLESYLRRKLDAAEFLVLVASPTAACSDWVKLETEHWLATRGTAEKMLIALVGNELEPSLPPAVLQLVRQRTLQQRPLYVRLVDRDGPLDTSRRNERFPDAVARLAAAVHGVDKDVLIDRDLREERRNRRLLVGAVAAGIALLLFACSTAGLAWAQRGHALAETRRAVQLRNLAESRQLAAQAATLRQSDPNQASLLSVGAYRLAPTAEARGALFASLGTPGFISAVDPSGAVFSPDGTLIAIPIGDGIKTPRAVIVWDRRTHRQRSLIPVFSATVAFLDSAGRYLATGGAIGKIQIWDTEHPAKPTAVVPLPSDIGELSSNPSRGVLVVTGRGYEISIWDIRDPLRPVRTAALSATGPQAAALSADGKTLARSVGDEAEVWDITDLARPKKLSEVRTGWRVIEMILAVSATSLLTSSSVDPLESVLWDVTSARPRKVATLPVTMGAFAPERPLLAVPSGHQITVYDASQPAALSPIAQLTAPGALTGLAFSPDGQMLMALAADGVWLWDVSTIPDQGAVASFVDATGSDVTALALAPQRGMLAVGTTAGTVEAWSVTNERSPHLVATTHEPAAVRHLAFSADGLTLVAAGSRYASGDLDYNADSNTSYVQVWDMTTVPFGASLDLPAQPSIKSLEFSADGSLVATAGNNGVDVWEIDPKRLSRKGHWADAADRERTFLAGDSSGRTLLVDEGVNTVSVGPNVVPVATSPVPATGPFAHHDSLLALGSGDDDRVRLLDVGDPARPTALGVTAPLAGPARSLGFVAGGLLVAGSDDAAPQIWDVGTPGSPRTVASLPAVGALPAVAAAPSTSLVAAGGTKGRISLWETDPHRQIAEICSAVGDLVDLRTWGDLQTDGTAPCA